jgi:hypothetical protein
MFEIIALANVSILTDNEDNSAFRPFARKYRNVFSKWAGKWNLILSFAFKSISISHRGSINNWFLLNA